MHRDILSDLKFLFRFPFQGPDWVNRFIIGCALYFAGWVIPIVPVLFVFGYAVEVMRRVIQGEEPGLPLWQDWGRLFVSGLRAFAVALVYLLPGTLIWLGGFAIYMVGSFGLIPFAERQQPDVFFMAFIVLMAICLLSFFVGSLLLFLGVIPLPAAMAHFVAEDRLGAAFQVRRWWTVLKERRWEYAIAWLLLFGIISVVYLAQLLLYYSVCLCWLIPISSAPVGFYATLVSAALFGLVWRDYIRSMESG